MKTARRAGAPPKPEAPAPGLLVLDVLVLGAGPAGAVIAAQLAGRCRVGLAGRAPPAGPAIGESLPAAARLLLADLGLWEAFTEQRHRPAWSRLSLWGADVPSHQDALFDPHGHGWHLDRARFDALLRANAVQHGAQTLMPAELRGITHTPGAPYPWHCELSQESGPRQVHCRLLVDATGRAARVARHADVAIERHDRLACLHTWLPGHGTPVPLPGATLVEAGPQGWWYSADLPGGGCVIAWHTDSDLPGAKACHDAQGLIALARETQLISQRCGPEALAAAAASHPPGPALHVTPAHSQWARQAAGTDWLAVGDAALAFDPLASQGLMNCLHTGLHAAQAALRHLDGDTHALPGWDAHTQDIADACRASLARSYAMEQRWLHEPFWQRRTVQQNVHAASSYRRAAPPGSTM